MCADPAVNTATSAVVPRPSQPGSQPGSRRRARSARARMSLFATGSCSRTAVGEAPQRSAACSIDSTRSAAARPDTMEPMPSQTAQRTTSPWCSASQPARVDLERQGPRASSLQRADALPRDAPPALLAHRRRRAGVAPPRHAGAPVHRAAALALAEAAGAAVGVAAQDADAVLERARAALAARVAPRAVRGGGEDAVTPPRIPGALPGVAAARGAGAVGAARHATRAGRGVEGAVTELAAAGRGGAPGSIPRDAARLRRVEGAQPEARAAGRGRAVGVGGGPAAAADVAARADLAAGGEIAARRAASATRARAAASRPATWRARRRPAAGTAGAALPAAAAA